jgi:signal peptidase I
VTSPERRFTWPWLECLSEFEHLKKPRLWIWTLLTLVAGTLLLRAFFFGVYYVDSPSMEPTLHGAASGGDRVLVAYGRAESIERQDIVVILPEDESEPLVKRVAGLPGESVLIRGGDLWIDGEILREEGMPWVPIFDERWNDLTLDFRMVSAWTRSAKGWMVDASEVPEGTMAASLYMRLGLKDHYLGPDGERVQGQEPVADAMIECSLEVSQPGFVMHLGLVEQGDVFELLLDTSQGSEAQVRLLHNRELVQQNACAWGSGSHELRFANANNRLTFDLDGEQVFSRDYASNRLFALDTARLGTSPPSDRVFIGGHMGRAKISGIRVSRDLHYFPRGDFAVQEAVELGPDQIFLLGDNSLSSRDGRDWGWTSLSEVIGRPIAVVWPLGHARILTETQGTGPVQ